jgi:carotenoid cleavage dioxygenase-like enzyme
VYVPLGATFLDAHKWHPELGVRVFIADNNDLSKQRWAQLRPEFFFHHGNTWEEADDTIHLDL